MKIVRPIKISDAGSFTRASTATYWDKDGVLQTSDVNAPRFNFDPSKLDAGPVLLFEPEATNFIRNNTMQGMVAGVPGVSPNNWGIFLAAGISREYVGSGQENGVDYVDVRFFGTTTSSGSFGIVLEMSNAVASMAAEDWSFSCFISVVGGVLPIANLRVCLDERDATSYIIGGYASIVPSDVLQRFDYTRTLINAATQFVQPIVYGNIDSNVSIDVTIRIGLPQLERDRVTSPIKTTNAAVTRAADVNTLGMLSPLSEIEYSPYYSDKIYVFGDMVQVVGIGTHKVYESSVGQESTVTLTIASPCVVTWPAHGLAVGTPVSFTTLPPPVGSLPTGIVAGQIYYVRTIVSPDTFQISATLNGAAVATTGTQIGPHTARASPNLAKNPQTNPTFWLDAGSTNKFAMLDQSVESQTVSDDYIAIAIPTPSDTVIDSVVLQNIENGVIARVVLDDPIEGVVYDRTISLIADSGIQDWYAYHFTPIERITDVAFLDLPPYPNARITASIVGLGETVKCGLFVAGLAKNFGPTQSGMSLGIQDYSVKEKSEYGNTTLREGSYSKTMNLTAWVYRQNTASCLAFLNTVRATPCVYIGDESISASIQFGTYKDYNQGIDYLDVHTLHIEIESLI